MSRYQNKDKGSETPSKAAGDPAAVRFGPKYVYRDFSRVPPDEGETALGAITNSVSNPASVKHQRLPIKLNALLNDPELTDIIAWLPHGRAWRILKPKLFVKVVLTKYFDYCNYNSFVRLINAWGFRRLGCGPDRHAYYHELFLRGLPHLHSRMHRISGRDEKPPIDPEDEPDLYRISEMYPVPPDSRSPNSSSYTPAAAVGGGNSVSSNNFNYSSFASPAYSLSSFPAAVAPLQNIPETANFSGISTVAYLNAARMLGTLSNPYPSYAAQSQQESAQLEQQLQESYRQLFLQSSVLPPYASTTSSNQQRLREQRQLVCFQGVGGRGRAASAAHSRVVTNASGETPIMYIPIYPSTLAGLGAGEIPSLDAPFSRHMN